MDFKKGFGFSDMSSYMQQFMIVESMFGSNDDIKFGKNRKIYFNLIREKLRGEKLLMKYIQLRDDTSDKMKEKIT